MGFLESCGINAASNQRCFTRRFSHGGGSPSSIFKIVSSREKRKTTTFPEKFDRFRRIEFYIGSNSNRLSIRENKFLVKEESQHSLEINIFLDNLKSLRFFDYSPFPRGNQDVTRSTSDCYSDPEKSNLPSPLLNGGYTEKFDKGRSNFGSVLVRGKIGAVLVQKRAIERRKARLDSTCLVPPLHYTERRSSRQRIGRKRGRSSSRYPSRSEH